MKDITLGYAFCGSFCTIKQSLNALKELNREGYKIKPIMSQIVYNTDTRFGKANELIKLFTIYLPPNLLVPKIYWI